MRTLAEQGFHPSYAKLKKLSYAGAILPALLIFSVQIVLLGSALVAALTDKNGSWTTGNIARVFADPLFRQGIFYTIVVPVVSVCLEALIGVGMAFWFMSIRRGAMMWRTIAVIPFALPEIVYLFTMKLLFREHGYLNSLLTTSFGVRDAIGWIEPGGALMVASVIVIDAWRVTPFVFLLVFAALEQLPQSYVEAAKLDGANRWNIMRRIQLPLVLPALGVALALRSIDAFRIFAAPLVLAGVEGLPVLSTVAYHYQADLNDPAGANVIALLLTAFLVMATAVSLWVLERQKKR